MRKAKDGRYQLRINTIILLKEGAKPGKIRERLLIGSETYCRWVRIYNKGGLAALKNIKITGRKEGNPEYDNYIFEELFKKLDLMQEYWSVIKMQKFVKDLHKIEVPNETMRMRVKRAGYSYKSNRPSPYKGDVVKQEEFKKTDSKMWSKN
ncbi:MAG: winged helix-turn-helix domain-containing protein [Sulfurimonas sp.]|nr:winged helix-turn-helix domain-containing protein [Sulfurimonas sp.]